MDQQRPASQSLQQGARSLLRWQVTRLDYHMRLLDEEARPDPSIGSFANTSLQANRLAQHRIPGAIEGLRVYCPWSMLRCAS